MLRIFCKDHHQGDGELCDECQQLQVYAHSRLDNCPFAAKKPACNKCTVHCYSAGMREQVKQVMRYAGPRMTLRHPLLAVQHLIDLMGGVRDLKKHRRQR